MHIHYPNHQIELRHRTSNHFQRQMSHPSCNIQQPTALPLPNPRLTANIQKQSMISMARRTATTSFTDRHAALSNLRSSLNLMTDEIFTNYVVGSYLVAAIERLDDYCEDARVELEILIADEARISQGYGMLLSLSSWISSCRGVISTKTNCLKR
jgi:hypothetical protein